MPLPIYHVEDSKLREANRMRKPSKAMWIVMTLLMSKKKNEFKPSLFKETNKKLFLHVMFH